jgi:Ca2+-binding EF-hand superfamily protein
MGKQSALAVILSVFAGASMAALPAFNDVDANGDGKITMNEASSIEGLMAAFDKADVDRDGLLSKAEYQKLKAKS